MVLPGSSKAYVFRKLFPELTRTLTGTIGSITSFVLFSPKPTKAHSADSDEAGLLSEVGGGGGGYKSVVCLLMQFSFRQQSVLEQRSARCPGCKHAKHNFF